MSAPVEDSSSLKFELLINCFPELFKDSKIKEDFVEEIKLMTSSFSTLASRENQGFLDKINRELQLLSSEVLGMSGPVRDSSLELSLLEEKEKNSQLMNEAVSLIENYPGHDQVNLGEWFDKVVNFATRASQSEERDINEFMLIAAKSLRK